MRGSGFTLRYNKYTHRSCGGDVQGINLRELRLLRSNILLMNVHAGRISTGLSIVNTRKKDIFLNVAVNFASPRGVFLSRPYYCIIKATAFSAPFCKKGPLLLLLSAKEVGAHTKHH